MQRLKQFLKNSYTAYHATENVQKRLEENGFVFLSETDDWILNEGGKYYTVRGGSSIIAFTVGSLDKFSFKIVATHTDSPALKLKENALLKTGAYCKLNVETYGGGIWYSFFDRPLKLAGRIVTEEDGMLRATTVTSPFSVCIPSVAVHQNRGVNASFSVNEQTDLLPLFALDSENADLLSSWTSGKVFSYDLFVVPDATPANFGVNDEFLSAPRIDNLSSVYASVEGLLSHAESSGISLAVALDNEEVGSRTLQGAGGDFLENTLRRIASALKFDDIEYYKALASSFLISLDNAHALHPNHPEKCDPTNRVVMGGGVVIKSHADKAYTTDALSSATMKKIFEKAGVKYQTFFNRSDMKSGGTLGAISLSHVGVLSVDLGLAQLAMHSACECIAVTDLDELVTALTAFYSSDVIVCDNCVTVL